MGDSTQCTFFEVFIALGPARRAALDARLGAARAAAGEHARVTELSARRKATQRKLSDVNLVERNLAVSQRLLSEERAKIA